MGEGFDDIQAPVTTDDKLGLLVRRAFAIARAKGAPAAEADARVAELAKAFRLAEGVPIEVAVTEAEFSSFTGGSEADQESKAGELNRLLCLQ
jgi:hypothetical protein